MRTTNTVFKMIKAKLPIKINKANKRKAQIFILFWEKNAPWLQNNCRLIANGTQKSVFRGIWKRIPA